MALNLAATAAKKQDVIGRKNDPKVDSKKKYMHTKSIYIYKD